MAAGALAAAAPMLTRRNSRRDRHTGFTKKLKGEELQFLGDSRSDKQKKATSPLYFVDCTTQLIGVFCRYSLVGCCKGVRERVRLHLHDTSASRTWR